MTIRLPEGASALPGPIRLWPIADAIGDPGIERATLVKPVRAEAPKERGRAAFILDPDGYDIEAVCHSPSP